jgi:hypothetical protein
MTLTLSRTRAAMALTLVMFAAALAAANPAEAGRRWSKVAVTEAP